MTKASTYRYKWTTMKTVRSSSTMSQSVRVFTHWTALTAVWRCQTARSRSMSSLRWTWPKSKWMGSKRVSYLENRLNFFRKHIITYLYLTYVLWMTQITYLYTTKFRLELVGKHLPIYCKCKKLIKNLNIL